MQSDRNAEGSRHTRSPAPGTSRVRVYVASSVDGFIAGPGDDLSWLPAPDSGADPGSDTGRSAAPGPDAGEDHGGLTYDAFIADVGALLMGRRTYEVVRGFGGEWPYGDRPVLVASHRDLDDGPPPTVRRVEGSIESLIEQAKEAAAGRDVYVDGGAMIRQACEAGCVDELTITLAPVALGRGHPLFQGMSTYYSMRLVDFARFPGGMLQLRLVPMSRSIRRE